MRDLLEDISAASTSLCTASTISSCIERRGQFIDGKSEKSLQLINPSLIYLVQEVDLVLGWVHVDVDVPRIELEGEVDEGVRALREVGRVHHLQRPLERGGVYQAVVDEEL